MSSNYRNDNPSLVRYMEDLENSHPYTTEEEADLARRIKKGDLGARNQLVSGNLRFVIRVAIKYQHRGLSLEELISAGNEGLIKAADRFDETRGFRFISYAVWWVRQACQYALSYESRTVRLPLNQIGNLARAKKIAASDYDGEDLEKIPPQELKEKCGFELSPEVLNATKIFSLDKPYEKDGDETRLDDLADTTPLPDEQVASHFLEKGIEEIVSTLSKREAEIVQLYYGLNGNDPHVLDEIGKKYGVTRERIRQIKEKALRKLRHPRRARKLRHYLESVG